MERERATTFIHELLELLVKQKGSDLFITAGFPPAIKVDGRIQPVSKTGLTPQHTMELVRSVMNDKQAARVRVDEGMQLRDRAAGRRPLPRQRVRAAGPHRHGAADDHDRHPEVRGARAAAGAEGRHHVEARHHDVRRRDRQRQIDVDGLAPGLPQREQLRPHHHDRGPDRVRPRAPELRRHAARGRGRHRRLADRAQEHAAPGAGRHSHRRSARARDDGLRDRLRGNRPPVPRDAAREQHEPGARPRDQLLPRGPPRAAPDGPVAQHPRVRRAAAHPAPRRPRPRAGRGGDAELAAHLRPRSSRATSPGSRTS